MTTSAVRDTGTFAYRELQAIGQIAHALLVADVPEDVHQFALDRVTPLLGASFSLVLLLDAAGEFMHAVAQHEWPERYGEWIGALRVRVGQGPSGVAVLEERVVEVPDLRADAQLSDWFDVARELGFRSIVAAPLMGSEGAVGAVAFYFANEQPFSAEQRDLVKLIADQLAATHEKAQMIAQLRRANAALAEANGELETQAREQHETQTRQLIFFDNFARAIVEGLNDVRAQRALMADASLFNAEPVHTQFANSRSANPQLSSMQPATTQPATTQHAQMQSPMPANASERQLDALERLAHAAHDSVGVQRGMLRVHVDDVEPRAPLLQAVALWRPRALPLPITLGEPTVLLPTMRTDVRLLNRALDLALGSAVNQAAKLSVGVHADVELGRGFVAYRLQWTTRSEAAPSDAGKPAEHPTLFDPFAALAAWNGFSAGPTVAGKNTSVGSSTASPLDLPLARSLARLLGGDVQRISERSGASVIDTLSLIFPLDAVPDTAAAMGRLSITHTY